MNKKHVHLIGIGGTGISAIARLLMEQGYEVSGSDRFRSPFVEELEKAGVRITIGHRPENVAGAELIVRSSAIPDDNPEVTAAMKLGIPVMKRAEFLGELMKGRLGIAVAGTHGKTTTTSMLAYLLTSLGQDPSYIIGGIPLDLGVNAHAGRGNIFLVEADEYDRMFLGLTPSIEVITNIEHDHPDCFPTAEDFKAAFETFMTLLPDDGTLVACLDDPGSAAIAKEAAALGKKTFTYGLSNAGSFSNQPDAYALDPVANKDGGFSFTADFKGKRVPVSLKVPGRHNILNALAALAVIKSLDLPVEKAAQVLADFSGTGRRFEVKGCINNITVIDDYAHHPSEIRSTLSAARSRYPSHRIWAVWQPHTYSRTRLLAAEFTGAFIDADIVIVTEVYPAREPVQDFSSRSIAEAMKPKAVFIAGLRDVENHLVNSLKPGDVLLVLSAGDADQVSTAVLERLKEASNG